MKVLDSVVHTQWRLVDSKWCCVCSEGGEVDSSLLLCDYLSLFKVDIPDYVRYCLIETVSYSLKFRHFGGHIDIYVHKIY